MSATSRRSLIAVIGTTAGITSLVIGPATPAQATEPGPGSGSTAPEVFKGPAPTPNRDAAEGTCFSWTNAKGFVGSVATSINVPTTARDNNVRDCLLRLNNQTDGVYKLQNAINVCYPQFSAGVGSDGKYGPNTERAVRQIQELVGVDADGVYGVDTKTAMKWPAYRQSNGSFYTCALLRS